MEYKVQALILKHLSFNDKDKIIKIFTKEKGLLATVCKGANNKKNPLKSKLQPLNSAQILLAKGKSLDIIKEAEIITSRSLSFKDIYCLNLAYFAVDIVETLSDFACEHKTIYREIDIFLEVLMRLDKAYAQDLPEELSLFAIQVSIEFLWKLICDQGYRPDLSICSMTGRELRSNQIPQYFDIHNGAICSVSGYKLVEGNRNISDYIVKLRRNTFKILCFLERYAEYEHFKLLESSLIDDISKQFETMSKISSDGSFEKIIKDLVREELFSTLKLLYRHLEHRTQKEAKVWKSIEELNYQF